MQKLWSVYKGRMQHFSIPSVFSSFGRRIHLVLPRKTRDRLNQGKELLLTVLREGLYISRLIFIVIYTERILGYYYFRDF